MFHVISIFGFRSTSRFGYEIFEKKSKNPENTCLDFCQYLRRRPKKKARNWHGDAQLTRLKIYKGLKYQDLSRSL